MDKRRRDLIKTFSSKTHLPEKYDLETSAILGKRKKPLRPIDYSLYPLICNNPIWRKFSVWEDDNIHLLSIPAWCRPQLSYPQQKFQPDFIHSLYLHSSTQCENVVRPTLGCDAQ